MMQYHAWGLEQDRQRRLAEQKRAYGYTPNEVPMRSTPAVASAPAPERWPQHIKHVRPWVAAPDHDPGWNSVGARVAHQSEQEAIGCSSGAPIGNTAALVGCF